MQRVLDANPGLAAAGAVLDGAGNAVSFSLFLPVGTVVRLLDVLRPG